MKESALRKLLVQKLVGIGDAKVHWQPIESGGVARGIPDLQGCFKGSEIFVELKISTPRLSGFQLTWHHKHVTAGGRTWVVALKNGILTCWRMPAERVTNAYFGQLITAEYYMSI